MCVEISEEITELMIKRLKKMDGMLKENKIRNLVDSAFDHSLKLKDGREEQVVNGLDRVQVLLNTPAKGRNQLLLVISAALQHMRRVEKFVLDGMKMDKWISRREEAVLVRLRVICASVIYLLLSAGDDLRMVPVPVRVKY